MQKTEIEKFTIDNYAMVRNKKQDIYMLVAELFDNGVKDGVVVVDVGWQSQTVCPRNPFHKINGKIEKINDRHFKIGDFEILEIDKSIENGAWYLQQWESLKEEEEEASRESCWIEVQKGIKEGVL